MAIEKKKILHELSILYPNPKPELDFTNPYETLIATILSAQCTDVQVNKVTPAVFRDFPTVEAMAHSTPEALYPYVKSCGFKSKATNIVLTSRKIMQEFNGEVPQTMEELTTLPGVGQKTANVVMANAFHVPSLAVDTHVFRVSNRLGLANAKNVEQTEEQLKKAIPKKDWIDAHHQLILHGRRVCNARSPKCEVCTLNPYCKYFKNIHKQPQNRKAD